MEVEAARLWLRAKSEPPPRHETGAAVDVGADIGVAAGLCRPYAVQCRDRTAPAQAGGTQAAEVELVNAHRKVRDPVHGLCRRLEGVHVDEVDWELDAFSTLLSLVRKSFGHGVMPDSVFRGDELRAHYVMRQIVSPELVSSVAIATHTERPVSRLTAGVIELMKQIAAATPDA